MPFPRAAQDVLSIFEVFNVNIAGLSLPLSCMGLGKYWQQMLFTIVFPMLLAGGIVLCSFMYSIYDRVRRKTLKEEPNKKKRSLLKAGGLLALPHLLTLSFLVFPMVSSTAFQAFSCDPFNNGTASFLRADFSVECDTAEHDFVRALAIVGILLYPFGVSGLYIVLFRKANRAILDEKPTALSKALGFLTLDFEKAWFAWELIEAWKKCAPAIRALGAPTAAAHPTAFCSLTQALPSGLHSCHPRHRRGQRPAAGGRLCLLAHLHAGHRGRLALQVCC